MRVICLGNNNECCFFSQPVEDISVVSWNRQVQHILASANPSGKAVVWDLRKNEPIIKISDHSNRVCAVNTKVYFFLNFIFFLNSVQRLVLFLHFASDIITRYAIAGKKNKNTGIGFDIITSVSNQSI